MALSDWLAGNGKFKKDAAKPTVADVADGLLHLEQETPQQTSAFAPTVAEIATVAGDSRNYIYNEYIYNKSKNNYSSDSATLATVATVGFFAASFLNLPFPASQSLIAIVALQQDRIDLNQDFLAILDQAATVVFAQ